jgi:hypothetical protein
MKYQFFYYLGEKVKRSHATSSSDEEISDKPSKPNKKEKWNVTDVYDSSSSQEDDTRKRSR